VEPNNRVKTWFIVFSFFWSSTVHHIEVGGFQQDMSTSWIYSKDRTLSLELQTVDDYATDSYSRDDIDHCHDETPLCTNFGLIIRNNREKKIKLLEDPDTLC